MGVPLFFRRVIQDYFAGALENGRPRCTTLALDAAGILHQSYQKLLEEKSWNVNDFVWKVFNEIRRIKNESNVQKRLIVSIDGIAPLGKMNQQRKRRFRHELESEPNNAPFDSNAISPGSALSIEVDRKLWELFRTHRSEFPRKLIYSGYRVPGEGEHKIISFLNDILDSEKNKEEVLHVLKLRHPELRVKKDQSLEKILFDIEDKIPDYQYFVDLSNTNESILIHGLDADLIFLSLPVPGQIFLWRENSFVPENLYQTNLRKGMTPKVAKARATIKQTDYLSIAKLRKQLEIYNIGLKEFILTGFIFGNDFVPFQAGFNLTSEVAPTFINVLRGRRFADPFNWEMFKLVLEEFMTLQPTLFPKLTGETDIQIPKAREVVMEKIKFPSTLPLDDFSNEWNRRLTFANELKLSDEEIEQEIRTQSRNYLSTLIWCLRYYQDHKSVNWEWVYYPYYAPLLQDIVKIDHFEPEEPQPKIFPLNILAQLVLILPKDLKTKTPNPIIPERYRYLQTPESPIADFYPTRFNIDRDGVNNANDGFAFIPYFDFQRLVAVFDQIVLTKAEEALYHSNVNAVQTDDLGLVEIEATEIPFTFEIPTVRSITDRWALQATKLYGEKIVNDLIGKTRQHFIAPTNYKWNFEGFEGIEIKPEISI